MRRLLWLAGYVGALATAFAQTHESPPPVEIVLVSASADARVGYGADQLVRALRDAGGPVQLDRDGKAVGSDRRIVAGLASDPDVRGRLAGASAPTLPESFTLATAPDGTVAVAGADEAGLLYGLLEVAAQVRAAGRLPPSIAEAEAPGVTRRAALVPAGAADADFWTGYLDFLAENRINTLEVVSGAEVPANEAARRGIRLEPTAGGPDPAALTFEPFRSGGPRGIEAQVDRDRLRLEREGLAIEPLCPAAWPWAPDRTGDRLVQYQRDWIWLEAWARALWSPGRSAEANRNHWLARLGRAYGPAAASRILDAYNDAGECAPRLARLFGVSAGAPLSLGLPLDRFYPALRAEAARLWAKEPPKGETPQRVFQDVVRYAEQAETEIDAAGPDVSANAEEFGRLQNDIHCVREMTLSYVAKAQAALLVLRHGYSNDPGDLQRAAVQLGASLDHYRALAQLTAEAYGAADGSPGGESWNTRLAAYEKEYAAFQSPAAGSSP